MESAKQLAAVESDDILEPTSLRRHTKRTGVTPQCVCINADLLVAARAEHVGAQRPAQLVDRVAKRATGAELVELRPEDRKDRVAADKTRASEREVGQQRKTLWLGDDAVERVAVFSFEMLGPEQVQADHEPLVTRPRGSAWRAASASESGHKRASNASRRTKPRDPSVDT